MDTSEKYNWDSTVGIFIMYDKNDFIYKKYKSRQRKNGFVKTKLYKIICDICGEKQGYGLISNKINYCKKCQYEKLSKIFSQEKIKTNCFICGKELEYTKSQFERSKLHCCSNECVGLGKRKKITEVKRNRLKMKMLQENISPICINCGHNNLWNLQAHHIVFVIKGGTNELSNLEFLCRNCHYDLHFNEDMDKGEKLK